MFIYYDAGKMRIPIQIWTDSLADIEEGCLEQAIHLANLPFAYHHIALMPDTHKGVGMPIGGVIACQDVVIPNAVGVDIGCGMGFVQTNIPAKLLREVQTGSGSLIQCIVGAILRSIPVGFQKYKVPQTSAVLDKAQINLERYRKDEALLPFLEDGYFQAGTLGGGNHFIEIQEDTSGMACIMLHSGSRNLGNQIGKHFNRLAREMNEVYFSSVPTEYNLAFLPVSSETGQQYLYWMHLAMDYAMENRAIMLAKVKEIFLEQVEKHTGCKAVFSDEINCHHNYADLENHFGKNVWVHRKGAIHAAAGEVAIIPGAMGANSYLVQGKGNADSFLTSSHGAGRRYSRSKAVETFSVQSVMEDLKQQHVVLGKNRKADVAEESRFAYKDIDIVMEQQRDLTVPIKKLVTVGVVKG